MEANFARRESMQASRQAREKRACVMLCAAIMTVTGCLRAAFLSAQPLGSEISARETQCARQRALLEGELKALQAESRWLDQTLHDLAALHGLGFSASATLTALSSLVSGQTALSSLAISPDAIVLLGSANEPAEVPQLVQSLEELFPGSCITLEGNAIHTDTQGAEAFEVHVEGWRDETERCPKKGGANVL